MSQGRVNHCNREDREDLIKIISELMLVIVIPARGKGAHEFSEVFMENVDRLSKVIHRSLGHHHSLGHV